MCRPFDVSSLIITPLTPDRAGSPASASYAIISENRASARFSAMRFSSQRRSNSSGETTGMANLVPINKIRRGRVQGLVRRVLRSNLDVDALDDFLASVDWSGTDQKRPKIADHLGQLEGWSSQYVSGDINQTQFIARLLSFLPRTERAWWRFFEDRPTIITLVRWVDRPDVPQLVRSGDEPQTGSDIPPQSAPPVPSSDIVLVA